MAAERRYCFTCTLGCLAAQFNRHGNCATATVDTKALGKFQAACVSQITVDLTTLLSCILTSKMKYYHNTGCCVFLALMPNAATL